MTITVTVTSADEHFAMNLSEPAALRRARVVPGRGVIGRGAFGRGDR